MLTIILTQDPSTGRGLFDNETKTLGIFDSWAKAEDVLGDLLRFCSIRYI